jgi:hypothetical protein
MNIIKMEIKFRSTSIFVLGCRSLQNTAFRKLDQVWHSDEWETNILLDLYRQLSSITPDISIGPNLLI